MTPQHLLSALRQRGATLTRRGDRLHYHGPRESLDGGFREAIQENRDAILAHMGTCASLARTLTDRAARLYPGALPAKKAVLVAFQHAVAECRDRGELDVLLTAGESLDDLEARSRGY